MLKLKQYMTATFRLTLFFLLFLRRLGALILRLGPLYLSKTLRKRARFEKRNILERSFAMDNLVADIAFEVSSEGELEQIRPLLGYYLKQKLLVEIVFASESVEKKCTQIYNQNPQQVRIFRLPLLSVRNILAKWVTAKHLVLCRYDFYPQLLLLTPRLSIVSATLKNKNISKKRRSLQRLYRCFDTIICASKNDQAAFFFLLGIRPEIFDFRILQIVERLSMSDKEMLDSLLPSLPREDRVILGSCWPSEMEIFGDKKLCSAISDGELFCALAPHKLGAQFLKQIESEFNKVVKKEVPFYHLSVKMSRDERNDLLDRYKKLPGVIMITVPGILCELYAHFGHAYVGGGFGRSIHSVLEPYLAGTNVICGPKTHRSTEFDLIKSTSPHKITSIDKFEDLYSCIKKESKEDSELLALIEQAEQDFFKITETINGELTTC